MTGNPRPKYKPLIGTSSAIGQASRRAVLLGVAALPLAGFSVEQLFAPSADLWDRWTAHDPASTQRIDHGRWSRFLAAHIRKGSDGVNRIAYGRIPQAERAALRDYIRQLAGVAISRTARPEQLAYWINLYNALTVQVVLDNQPVDSIRDIDISPGLFADGPWDKDLVSVEGEEMSLNDIEHRILRPIWHDPRIHYGVNCASIGCPDLQTSAYTADNTEELLDRAARDYVNHPRGCRLAGGKLQVSSIYVWFQEDFGGSDQGVISHLRRFATPELAARLAQVGEIDGHDYDWALNGERRGSAGSQPSQTSSESTRQSYGSGSRQGR